MDLKTQGHYDKHIMRPLKNSIFCHYWLDPESREWLKILDSGFRDCVIIGKNVIPNECEES